MNDTSKKAIEYEVKPWAVKVNLDFLGDDSSALASFVQKLVYFVCVDYLRDRITKELSRVERGTSHWLSQTFLYRSLSFFNSGIADDHLFDKNDLSELSYRLNSFILNCKPSITFRLGILGRFVSLAYGEGCLYVCFHEFGDVSSIEKMKIDPVLNAVLVNVLENRI